MTMTAFRLLDWGQVGFDEVEIPIPGPGEVLMRVGGAGICGSDVHFQHITADEWPSTPPWTLGHENAGWVHAQGPSAHRFELGEAVIATGVHSCGRCRVCIRGDDNLCAASYSGRGVGADGGFAQFVVVPERELVALGSLDPRVVAPLADAGHTTYAAVKGTLDKLTPDATALVIGVGGLGSFGIQFIKLLSAARVIAVDLDPAKRDRARTLGADEVLASDASTAAAVRELTAGEGADVVFDFVGTQATITTALACAGAGGSVVLLGVADGATVQLAFAQTPPAGCHLYWNLGGNYQALTEVVALAQRGLLQIDVEPIAFDDIGITLARLERGELSARAVARPNG
jgi:propanol-preferring alcohol dehydrogenase